MVNNNNLIPKTEIVAEIKSEIPTYEEFMKTYQADEQVKASYDNEINSYNDLGVEKGYGPATYKCMNCNAYKRSRYEAGCRGGCGTDRCRECCESCNQHS